MSKNIILSNEEIQVICARLGKEITELIKQEKRIPVVVGVLKGSMNFMMDLIKNIDTNIYTDYIQIRSYSGTESTGRIQLIKDLSFDCAGRTVIIVEDIVDTGLSMEYLLNHVKAHNPKKVYVCSLFDKKNARKNDVKVDFVGKVLEKNDFLIGYGLDFDEICRNVPYVYAATKEDVDELKAVLEEDKK